MPSPWTRLRAAVHPHARRLLGLYEAYPLNQEEYVGTLGNGYTLADARHYLRQNGYTPQYLSAAKRHPQTGALHDLSYRRVPTRHPPAALDTALEARFAPAACQYHAHVFQTADGGPVFYSHYEARPDPLRPAVDLARLRTHYRPTTGETYLEGVTDLQL